MTIKFEQLIRGDIILSYEEEDILSKAADILDTINAKVPADAEFYDCSTGEIMDRGDLCGASCVIDYFRFNGRGTEESVSRSGFIFSGHE